MTNRFRQRIRDSLADADLQTALDRYVARVRTNTAAGYASLTEDLHFLRGQAHAVRSQTIAHLDEYLGQFCQRASANGMIVHNARDAAAACRIAVEIAESHNVRTVVKSKSMVTEEIRLNTALEAAGMVVIETDLGEFIIQLRGEGPSHITAPAIHLKREQIGQTFHEKLGTPYTDDVRVMTDTARKKLRKAFIQADLGISGVNFGVAESGSLCIITNEGNGRMVTTLPRIHIAIMGIERVVPTFKDLALMLNLLPRSATGQKITVYTSIINRPRNEVDDDGPLERHIILIDNSRSALRNTALRDALLCIRCGACLNVCPIFQELGGLAYTSSGDEHTPYPGPIGSIVSPGLFGQQYYGHLAQASSLCGACREACPVDIDLPILLTRVRAGGRTDRIASGSVPHGVPKSLFLLLKLYTWFCVNSSRFVRAQRISGFLSRLFSPRARWMRLPLITGWGATRALPRVAKRTFRMRWEALRHTEIRNSPPPESHPVDSPTSSKEKSTDSSAKPENRPIALKPNSAELVKRFEHEVNALEGTLTCCNAEQLNTNIVAFLQENEARKLLAWESDQLPDGLIQAIQQDGVEVIHDADPSVKFGLSGADTGIAETGTFSVSSGRGRPLTASLLPEVHLVVLRAQDIYPDLESVLMHPSISDYSVAALISGPSRTADIELTLTLGVHGPKQVHIFCVMDNLISS